MLLGCYCNNPELAIRYETVPEDYPELFHKVIFGAIVNLAIKGANKITHLDIENELSAFPASLDIWKHGQNNGAAYIEKAIEDTKNMLSNVEMYWDNVRKFSILRNTVTELKMDVSFVYEEYDELDITDRYIKDKKIKMEKFNNMTSQDLLRCINDKFMQFNETYKSHFGSNYSFHMGDKISDLLEKCKTKEDTYGYGFQNLLFNTIFRGKKAKKYVIISRPTGHGKSRGQLGNALDLGCSAMYDWVNGCWVDLGECVPVLYCTSELTDEEVQMISLAHISGISEDRITEWNEITPEEEEVLKKSTEILANSKCYCEYIEEFNINIIEDMVRKYVVSHGIFGLFFDYISENNGLYSESYAKTGMKLQSHQILLSLSNALKLICNKYGLYLETSTQMNDNYKQEGNMDASSIRGAKAIADKCDVAMIGMRMTQKDHNKIKTIMEEGFYKTPNYCYYCYKNRGGKLVDFICFTKTDLGTAREEAIFITDKDYNLIDVAKTDLGFNVPVPIGVKLPDFDGEVSSEEYIQTFREVN